MSAKNDETHRPSSDDTLVLDGSTGEGGGQILRNSISYATIFQRNMEINQIRAKRSKPGLRAQHVASLQLPVSLCGGTLVGDSVGSSTVRYTPPLRRSEEEEDANQYIPERNITEDIGTAGSICLLLQATLPCALFHSSASYLTLIGGTNAALAPQYDYWHDVFLPTLKRHCCLAEDQIQANVDCRGYFPKGGGKVRVAVQPLEKNQALQPIQLTERGELASIHIRSFHAGKLPRHLAQSMARSAERCLAQDGMLPPSSSSQAENGNNNNLCTVEVVTETQAVGSALGVIIVATTTTGCKIAGSALSTPQQKADKVGQAAAEELLSNWQSGGCVDEWLQDQLILYMALAQGTSRMVTGCLTLHTQTAIWAAEQFCGRQNMFRVEKMDQNNKGSEGTGYPTKKLKVSSSSGEDYGQDGLIEGLHIIECNGIGFHRKANSGV